jgi:hypothetical protein
MDKVNVLVTLIVAASVAITGIHVVESQDIADQIEYEHDMATAYGNQTYGADNYTLHMSRVIGGHGGYHLELDNGTLVHLHDVPREKLERAYAREHNASVRVNATGFVSHPNA